jgi:hypothetical protein
VGADREGIRSGLSWAECEVSTAALVEKPEVCCSIDEVFKTQGGE